MEIELKTPVDLAKALHDIRGEIGQVKSTHDRLSLIEKGTNELRETVQGIRLAQQHDALDARSRRNDPDSQIERSYMIGDVESKSMSRQVSRSFGGISYDRAPVYGSDKGVVRMLGATDDCGDYTPGLLDDPNPGNDWQRELQRRANDLGLYRMITGNTHAPLLTRRIVRHLQRGPDAIAKVFADNSGEGGEFIADIVLPEVFSTMRTPASLEAQFARTTLGTGGSTLNPFYSDGVQPFISGVPASGDLNPAELVKSVPTTSSLTTAPKTFAVVLPVNRDAQEDSIAEWGGFGSMLVSTGLADGVEDAIVNADTAASHQDAIGVWAGPASRWATVGHANDHRKAWIGLRARAFDVSATADKSAAQTVADAIGWRAQLSGGYRGSPGDLMYVISYGHLIAKWLTDSNFLTLDKAGPLAGLFTGAVGAIGGVGVHVSDYVTEDLNASGLFDNSVLDYTTGLICNRTRFQVAERRGARIEVETSAIRHTSYHVASRRLVFRTTDAASTKNVFAAFKLSKS